MSDTLNWGILAAGRIAGTFARGVAASRTGRVVAVASRSQDKADRFAAEFKLPRAHGSYEALLADPEVQAVYIATPHPMHAEWAIKAAEAGKHLLVEKPLAVNFAQAMAVVEAAGAHDVFLMEAFMYRCHPQTARLVKLVRQGAIGQVRMIRATFGFHAGFNAEGRLFRSDLAGGGIMDVGCYATSMVRLIAGAATGRDFAEPLEVSGGGHVGQSGVDEWAVASLKFPGDVLAQLSTSVSLAQDNTVRIFGSEGWIEVPQPWIPAREGGEVLILVKGKGDAEPRQVHVETDRWLYGLEADAVAEAIEAGRRQAAPPAMTWDDTLGNMRALDRWRAAVGLVFEIEKPGRVGPVGGRSLAVRPGARPAMKYGRIPGLDKPVSRLVMGVDNQPDLPHAAVMFDDFFERGGNCFDTAYVYGGGRCERLLGQWVADRGIRDQVVILDKGAHTPNCNPKALAAQFRESLDRLGADYVDIYLMHRDNPEVPVGEFVDVLNELKRAGGMRVFGVSNWTLPRLEAANDYASAGKVDGMTVLSNNFSLARMVQAPWGGCLACADSAWRKWLKARQLTLMPWSSQARGFFTGRADPSDRSDAELVRCWYADDNFRRLARARELAERRGVEPIAIALAYVLQQPFPTFPLIGPRTLAETRTSLPALEVELSEQELNWLNLEA